MSESANVRLVRRMYEAWDAMDVDTVFALLHPEVRWVNPDYAVEPGIRHGHVGFATAMKNLKASFAHYSHVLGEVSEHGESVLWHTVFCVRGRDSGAEVRIPEQHLWRIADGLIVELRWFHDEAEARQAAAEASPGPVL